MKFEDFGLSKQTNEGLKSANYTSPTPIQKETIPFSLEGRDVLAQAKTGSGKTLAFLIPLLEKLHSANWGQYDGLGALVISPTRELALQIFDVLRKVGKKHSFSAGLLIGGKDLKQEQERINRMNILIATPGRLLQHMDQTPEFDCSNLQLLVLDEADRILDAGFERSINAIIENLPEERQTLLFSATQTKAVKDLARLSVKNAEYVSTDEKSSTSTPKNLQQRYIVCELPQKLDILFSFIKTHLKQKIVVFLSSCKQVRFVFEAFCKMQPGIPLLCLHGKQSQQKRMAVFNQFSMKTEACLFATDVAARGLDIPLVDWVIQVDCPDEVQTYIHRVGRTARYNQSGHALLLLLPSEKKMVELLEAKRVPIEEIKVNPAKTKSIKGQLSAICSQSPDMKYLAQKAFICYLRSIYLQSNKEVFDVHQLPFEDFADSLGLPGAPQVKFTGGASSKNKSRQMEQIDNKEIRVPKTMGKKKQIELANAKSDSEEEVFDEKKPKTRIDKMFSQKNLTVLSEHYRKLAAHEDADSDDELLQIKRVDHDVSDDETMAKVNKKKPISKVKRSLLENGLNQKIVFDDDGNARKAFEIESLEQFEKNDIEKVKSEYMEKQSSQMKSADVTDKAAEKERRRQLKRERKLKEKQIRREEVSLLNLVWSYFGTNVNFRGIRIRISA
jgi:ATP-dependent RNA helicase DDX10/DBP4